MKVAFFLFSTLIIAGNAQATLLCQAKGKTHEIRLISLEPTKGIARVQVTLLDGTTQPAADYPIKADTSVQVMGEIDRGPYGRDVVTLVKSKTDSTRYALKTSTLCAPSYQEEMCIDRDQVIEESMDYEIECKTMSGTVLK